MRLLGVTRFFAILIFFLYGANTAIAQTPVPSYPLFCQGPLEPESGMTPRLMPFKWASLGAGAATPGAGQCAWADRPPGGPEIKSGGGNNFCDFSGALASVPAGTFVDIGAYRDPAVNNCMHVTHWVGSVTPPFSAQPKLTPFVRKSISTLTDSEVAALRHGIQVMMSRPKTDPTSFAFQANIHGTYDSATTAIEQAAWNQCQHGSYYFLSWHRMYLYFFDRILRAASGDAKLALPYWNWSDPAQRALPIAFRVPADASNALYLAPPSRPTNLDNGTALLPASAVDFAVAFAASNFDSSSGSGQSFGGQIATPEQFNGPHGLLESQPHDVVHVALNGLMSDPDTAANDPIFWLHHANIDRMWKRWLDQGDGRTNPADQAWLNKQFLFFDEAGREVHLTGQQVVDTVAWLDYRYDDDAPTPFSAQIPLNNLHPIRIASAVGPRNTIASTKSDHTQSRIELTTQVKSASVTITERAATGLRAAVDKKTSRHALLVLNDLQYEKSGGVFYEIYLNAEPNQSFDFHDKNFVGTLSFFGLKHAHAHGSTAVSTAAIFREYDITQQIRALTVDRLAKDTQVTLTLVPRGLVTKDGASTVEPSELRASIGEIRIVVQ